MAETPHTKRAELIGVDVLPTTSQIDKKFVHQIGNNLESWNFMRGMQNRSVIAPVVPLDLYIAKPLNNNVVQILDCVVGRSP